MSSPVASVPLAVLVLAWDETTPATRVPLEAIEMLVPTPDPIAVLVPVGPLTEALSQEEFLPLEVSYVPPSSPEPPAELPAAAEAAQAPAVPVAIADLAPLLPTAASPLEVITAPAANGGALPLPTAVVPAIVAALVGPALVWQEVRVLHLPTPAATQQGLVWQGEPVVPAAPYLGNSGLAQANQGTSVAGNPTEAVTFLAASSAPSTLSALSEMSSPGEARASTIQEAPTLPQPAYLTDELPAAADAESDALPTPTADASTTELNAGAANPTEPFAVDASPVQTEPIHPILLLTEVTEASKFAAENQALPATEPLAPPSPTALQPPAQAFDAPNLNFQIIQYARLAVPLALAAQPFTVIYAPAWPTWLAAQELRQRTGQPLVLHLAALAAEAQPVSLAAGWPAEIQRQALHRADLILTETPELAYRLRRELDLPAHRVRPVPAADTAAVAQALHTVHAH